MGLLCYVRNRSHKKSKESRWTHTYATQLSLSLSHTHTHTHTHKHTSVTHNPPDRAVCHWSCSRSPQSDVCCGQRSDVCYNAPGSVGSVWRTCDSNNRAAGWTASEKSCSWDKERKGWDRSWWRQGYELQHCSQSGPLKCPAGRGIHKVERGETFLYKL